MEVSVWIWVIPSWVIEEFHLLLAILIEIRVSSLLGIKRNTL